MAPLETENLKLDIAAEEGPPSYPSPNRDYNDRKNNDDPDKQWIPLINKTFGIPQSLRRGNTEELDDIREFNVLNDRNAVSLHRGRLLPR